MKELSTEKMMTVKEVAHALKVTERTIRNYVTKLRHDLSGVKNKQGGYLFNEKDVTLIKLTLEKNQHLDNVNNLPKTALDKQLLIKQAMFLQNEMIEELQGQITTLKPKAKLAELAIRDEKEHYSIRDAGKHLGLKQKEMFDLLRSKGLLTMDNLPTSKAIKYKVLQLRSNAEINGRNRPQSIMTMANIHEFQKRYVKESK